MAAIAWAVFVAAIIASDTARALKWKDECYETSSLHGVFIVGGTIALVISTVHS